MKKFLVLVLVIAAASLAYWQNQRLQHDSYTGIAISNGRLNLNRLDIASLYAGRVQEVLINEGDMVNVNQTLLRLSTNQVEAQVNQVKAKRQQALEAIERVKAEQVASQEQLNLAQLELNNAQKLHKDKLISGTELARHQTQYAASLAKLNAIKAAQAEAESMVKAAEAQLAQIEDMQNDFDIKAPIAGRIEYKLVEPGSVIPAGGRVMSLLDTQDVYLNVFLPAHQINPLKIGDEARLQIEGVDAVFPTTIQFIAADAQFTPKSVETAEERAKLMFKVKLSLDKKVTSQYPGLFKGGMTALGYVKYDHTASWPETLNIKLP